MRKQTEREWLTWRQVCKQLAKLGIVANAPEALALMKAIKLWGEELAELRIQNPGTEERALSAAREKYEGHVLDGWAP